MPVASTLRRFVGAPVAPRAIVTVPEETVWVTLAELVNDRPSGSVMGENIKAIGAAACAIATRKSGVVNPARRTMQVMRPTR
jgi:hypothetical protein